jgi:hypothetical protein
MSAPTPEWTDKITAWRHSGLSIAAWCRENSESYYRFLYWRDRVPGEQRQEPGKFVAVCLAATATPISLECNGVYVHVSAGFDAGLLEDVLSLLKRG